MPAANEYPSAASVSKAAPVTFWASQPVSPGETVLVSGGNLSADATALVTRLDDTEPGSPLSAGVSSNNGWTSVAALQSSATSMKFALPTVNPGVFAYRMKSASLTGAATLVNAPDVWFVQGDQGYAATPGGKLKVFGTSLSVPKGAAGHSAQIALVKDEAVVATIKADPADPAEAAYGLQFSVPPTVAPGEYTLYVHNGFGGPSSWRKYSSFGFGPSNLSAKKPITTITVANAAVWPSKVCPVGAPKTDGTSDDASFAAAFQCAQAGGIVQMSAGTYTFKAAYAQGLGGVIPNLTVLRGNGKDGAAATVLSFPMVTGAATLMSGKDASSPYPAEYGTGTQYTQGLFGVESLAISAPGMTAGIGIWLRSMKSEDSGYVPYVKNVKMVLGQGVNTTRGISVYRVSNVKIIGNDITAGIPIDAYSRAFGALVENNTLRWAAEAIKFAGSQNVVIVHNNLIHPDQALPTGIVTVAFPAPTQDVYYAGNTSTQIGKQSFWGMTFDEGSGIYFGKAASSKGSELTLAKPVQNLSYLNNVGMSVMIMAGKGEGQMRTLVGNPDPTKVVVDKPWDVEPDNTSVISICVTLGRMLFVNNTYGADALNNMFFPSADVIQANNKWTGDVNTLVQQTGAYQIANGVSPGWHFQVLNNRVTRGSGSFASQGVRRASAFGPGMPDEWYSGPITQTAVLRNNVFDPGVTGSVSLWDDLSNSLIEGNVVPGIEIHNAKVLDSLIRNNVANGTGEPSLRNDSGEAVLVVK